MNQKIVEFPFLSNATAIPPRCRTPKSVNFLCKAPVVFPVVSDDEIHIAFEAMGVSVKAGDPVPERAGPSHYEINGQLYYKSDIVIGPGAVGDGFLKTIRERELGFLRPNGTKFAYTGYAPCYRPGEIDARKIIEWDVDKDIASLQDSISENVVLSADGSLFHIRNEPRLVYVHGDNDGGTVSISFSDNNERSFFSIPVDIDTEILKKNGLRLKTTEDYGTSTYYHIPGLETSGPVCPVLSPFKRTLNPVITNAIVLAHRASLNITNSNPFGDEVQELGEKLMETPAIDTAQAFVAAFEERALQQNAQEFGSYASNARWFSAYHMINDMLPDHYFDPAAWHSKLPDENIGWDDDLVDVPAL